MKILLDNISENRERWLEIKQNTVGSSEVATICGMNRYETPLGLWARKTGKLPPKKPTEAMLMGTELEPITGRLFARKKKLKVTQANCLVGHESIDFISASPDFWVETPYGTKILEAKFTTPRNRHIWDNGAPQGYLMQLNWQLSICGVDYGYLAGLIGGDADDFKSEDFQMSPELFEVCLEEAFKFIQCVRSDIPPNAGPGDSKLLGQLQGERSKELLELQWAAVEAADYFEEVRERRLAAQALVKVLDDEYDGAKAQLMQQLGSVEKGLLPDGRVVSAKVTKNNGYTVEPFEYVLVNVRKK